MSGQKQTGLSYIEMIIFIIVMGIIATGLLAGINQSQKYSGIARNITEASFLANARMQVILMNRAINGYSSLNDPCTATPSLAICTPLSSYASTNSFTVSTPTISGSNPKNINVTVSGYGNANINASVYNYANN